jgi:hypothetical protein
MHARTYAEETALHRCIAHGTGPVDHVRRASWHKTFIAIHTSFYDLTSMLLGMYTCIPAISYGRHRGCPGLPKMPCKVVPVRCCDRRSLTYWEARARADYDVFCCCRVWESKLSEGLNIKGHVSTTTTRRAPYLPTCVLTS